MGSPRRTSLALKAVFAIDGTRRESSATPQRHVPTRLINNLDFSQGSQGWLMLIPAEV